MHDQFGRELVALDGERRILGGSAEGASEQDVRSVENEPWGKGFLEAARQGRVEGGNAASFLTSF